VAAVILGGSAAAHAAVTASVNGSKLTVTGDGSSNQVTILQYDEFNTLYVIDDLAETNLIVTPSNGIEKIDVNLGADDDYFTYRPAHYDEFIYPKKVKVNLGSGDDYGNFPFNSYANDQIIIQGNLDISVKAGPGDDYVNGMFGDKPGGKLSFKADLGDGDDQGYSDLWGDVTANARIKFDLRGGKGNDRVQTWSTYVTGEGYDAVNVGLGSTVTMKFMGGTGDDEANNVFGGDVDGRVSILSDLGADQDSSNSTVSLSGASSGFFTNYLMGKAGDDDLHMDAGPNPFFGSMSVVIDGGNNSDTCETTGSASELNCEL